MEMKERPECCNFCHTTFGLAERKKTWKEKQFHQDCFKEFTGIRGVRKKLYEILRELQFLREANLHISAFLKSRAVKEGLKKVKTMRKYEEARKAVKSFFAKLKEDLFEVLRRRSFETFREIAVKMEEVSKFLQLPPLMESLTNVRVISDGAS